MMPDLRKLGLKGLLRKIRGRIRKPSPPLPYERRAEARLFPEGERISVELALNSRCSSDDDDDPTVFHWGMFDRGMRLSDKDIQRIVDLSRAPRYTSWDLGIRIERNVLFVVSDPLASGIQKDWLMVECGMLQQAVFLACASLGVGSVIANLGRDGRILPDGGFASVRIRIDPMKPSYQGSLWSSGAPGPGKRWRQGNLQDPRRDGAVPLGTALAGCAFEQERGTPASVQTLGQLLWAARGRTPHLYKSTPWGLTIPVWSGDEELSGLSVLAERSHWKYVNWRAGRPTHSLSRPRHLPEQAFRKIMERHKDWDCLMILSSNDPHTRALWEIGYQLQNIIVQAHSWGVDYRVLFADRERKDMFARNLGMADVIIVIGLRLQGSLLSSSDRRVIDFNIRTG